MGEYRWPKPLECVGFRPSRKRPPQGRPRAFLGGVRGRTVPGAALGLIPLHAARASLEGVSHARFCDAASSLSRRGGSLDDRLHRRRNVGSGRGRRLPVHDG